MGHQWRSRIISRAPARVLMCACVAALLAVNMAAQTPELRWGGDAEGGAPFVEADPNDPTRVVGFEVDIASMLAERLNRRPRFIQTGFTTIDASVARGDFDIGLSGIEDSFARRTRLAVTVPYYRFREILTVRAADAARYRTLADLRGRRVATLAATLAFDLLTSAEKEHGVVVVPYEDDVHPYTDLAVGRVDGVLLDEVLAERGVRRHPALTNQPTSVGVGYYVGILAPQNTELRNQIDAILKQAMRDGRLEAIFRRWNMWNEDQRNLYARVTADESGPAPQTTQSTAAQLSVWDATARYLPSLLTATVITLVLSVLSMALAIVIGVLIASGRVYGPSPLRALLTGWVELIRGTPLLLQLFVIYYGLATVVQLPAFLAALIGLGLNYGAYESEIYRSALESVPPGQLDAARTLGFSDRQTLMLIRGPQALRLALAPMTNDFVALLKDSSLVSLITVVELTKQTTIFASNIGTWFVPGLLCAALYLVLSLPVSHLARRLERTWRRT
jgi:polar amino acid transport system substrate-binding protein